MEYHQNSECGESDKYYQAWCHECDWKGCSCQLEGGQYNAYLGDHDDVHCPECDSQEVEDKPKRKR